MAGLIGYVGGGEGGGYVGEGIIDWNILAMERLNGYVGIEV